MRIKVLIIAIISLFFLNYAYADGLSKNIFITNIWVQAMPPSQATTAAYMTITNDSTKETVLTSVSCDIAQAAEIHQMSESSGMMHMAMVSNVHIPAQGKVVLAPNGFHIMLINLKKPVNKGDIVPITLHFQDGSEMLVKAPVRMRQPAESSGMAGMKM